MRRRVNYRRRGLLLSGVMGIAGAALAARAIYLATNESVHIRANLILATRTPGSLQELEAQAGKIDAVATNIDEYKLKDIKNLLNDTAALAATASRELKAQSDAWDVIKSKAADDVSTYEEVKHNLDVVTGMKNAEIVRLNQLLEQSKKPSTGHDVLELLLSFFLGIFSSWAAAASEVRFKNWRKKRKVRLGSRDLQST